MTIQKFVKENSDFIKSQTIASNITMLAFKKGVSLNSSVKFNELKTELMNIGVDYNKLDKKAASSDAEIHDATGRIPKFGGNGDTIKVD